MDSNIVVLNNPLRNGLAQNNSRSIETTNINTLYKLNSQSKIAFGKIATKSKKRPASAIIKKKLRESGILGRFVLEVWTGERVRQPKVKDKSTARKNVSGDTVVGQQDETIIFKAKLKPAPKTNSNPALQPTQIFTPAPEALEQTYVPGVEANIDPNTTHIYVPTINESELSQADNPVLSATKQAQSGQLQNSKKSLSDVLDMTINRLRSKIGNPRDSRAPASTTLATILTAASVYEQASRMIKKRGGLSPTLQNRVKKIAEERDAIELLRRVRDAAVSSRPLAPEDAMQIQHNPLAFPSMLEQSNQFSDQKYSRHSIAKWRKRLAEEKGIKIGLRPYRTLLVPVYDDYGHETGAVKPQKFPIRRGDIIALHAVLSIIQGKLPEYAYITPPNAVLKEDGKLHLGSYDASGEIPTHGGSPVHFTTITKSQAEVILRSFTNMNPQIISKLVEVFDNTKTIKTPKGEQRYFPNIQHVPQTMFANGTATETLCMATSGNLVLEKPLPPELRKAVIGAQREVRQREKLYANSYFSPVAGPKGKRTILGSSMSLAAGFLAMVMGYNSTNNNINQARADVKEVGTKVTQVQQSMHQANTGIVKVDEGVTAVKSDVKAIRDGQEFDRETILAAIKETQNLIKPSEKVKSISEPSPEATQLIKKMMPKVSGNIQRILANNSTDVKLENNDTLRHLVITPPTGQKAGVEFWARNNAGNNDNPIHSLRIIKGDTIYTYAFPAGLNDPRIMVDTNAPGTAQKSFYNSINDMPEPAQKELIEILETLQNSK